MVIELSYSLVFDAHDSFQDLTLDMMIDSHQKRRNFVVIVVVAALDMMIDSYEKRRNFVVVAAAAIVGVSVLVIFGFAIVAAAPFG